MSQDATARLVLITQSRDDGGHQTDVLSYQRVNQDYLVVATNETKNTKPAWYLNLKSDPVVQVELGQMSFYAHASTPTGKARLRLTTNVDSIRGSHSREIPRESTAVLLSPI